MALFLLHPIRLSRAAVFLQSLVCAVYSALVTLARPVRGLSAACLRPDFPDSAHHLASRPICACRFGFRSLQREWRPWYALTWLVKGTVNQGHEARP